ncbi:hypothetical protein OPT61_g8632 [Boeremia exigua]|uniref:Uncharacterized protein n=1 Tax=Boeremia exigua TaxID=749465 RepID=A0ACC2HYK6_9PLEO|nr:hypothetical protein OPT61_g8632 [Boeremia exigua]
MTDEHRTPPHTFEEHFLKLPRELRDLIYAEIFADSAIVPLDHVQTEQPGSASLTVVGMEATDGLGSEILEAFYTYSTFSVTFSEPGLDEFAGSIGCSAFPQYEKHIRKLVVHATETNLGEGSLEELELACRRSQRSNRAQWEGLLQLPRLEQVTVYLQKQMNDYFNWADFSPVLVQLRESLPQLRISFQISFDAMLETYWHGPNWSDDLTGVTYYPMGFVDVAELIAPPTAGDVAYVQEHLSGEMTTYGRDALRGLLDGSVSHRRALAVHYVVKEPELLRVRIMEHFETLSKNMAPKRTYTNDTNDNEELNPSQPAKRLKFSTTTLCIRTKPVANSSSGHSAAHTNPATTQGAAIRHSPLATYNSIRAAKHQLHKRQAKRRRVPKLYLAVLKRERQRLLREFKMLLWRQNGPLAEIGARVGSRGSLPDAILRESHGRGGLHISQVTDTLKASRSLLSAPEPPFVLHNHLTHQNERAHNTRFDMASSNTPRKMPAARRKAFQVIPFVPRVRKQEEEDSEEDEFDDEDFERLQRSYNRFKVARISCSCTAKDKEIAMLRKQVTKLQQVKVSGEMKCDSLQASYEYKKRESPSKDRLLALEAELKTLRAVQVFSAAKLANTINVAKAENEKATQEITALQSRVEDAESKLRKEEEEKTMVEDKHKELIIAFEAYKRRLRSVIDE